MAWYIILSAAGILSTAGVLFATHGEAFNLIFFKDSLDTGMDFFHSIEYVRGRAPYELFRTLYPPLANLFFYLLICFVPEWQYSTWAPTFREGIAARSTPIDLRVWQPTMVLFILFILLTAVLLIFLVQRCFDRESPSMVSLFALTVLLSGHVLYALERGNIVILSMMCTLFFVRHMKSANRWLSALSLVMLGLAAGLKIYPALFGMMLIYNRQYKKAAAAVAIGIACFILPTLAFREGLGGIKLFLEILTGHYDAGLPSTEGFCFDRIVNTVAALFCRMTGREFAGISWLNAVPGWNLPVSLLILLCGFLMKKRWQQSLACCLAMLLFQFQYSYAAVFLLIPLIMIIAEEKTITRANLFPFLTLTFGVILLPLMEKPEWTFSQVYGRCQLCMVLLTGYLLWTAAQTFMNRLFCRPKHLR